MIPSRSKSIESSGVINSKCFKIHCKGRKIGVVADTYDELQSKCASKFNIEIDKLIFSLEDDTEVDEEYFEVLGNNEDLYISDHESISSQILSKMEDFLELYMQSNFNDLDSQLQDILQLETFGEILKALCVMNYDISTCIKSSIKEDSAWFRGLDTKYKMKEAVLRNSAENRMRGYFQKFKKDLEKFKGLSSYQNLITDLTDRLKSNRYNGFYFDRSSSHDEKLCDNRGTFRCYGDFLSIDCPNQHFVNPYSSREDRILFSTWNFDHVIEKSRSIIPAVSEALEEYGNNAEINADYIFELLFKHHIPKGKLPSGNLKLVHIVCHNKNPHNLECDARKIRNLKTKSPKSKRLKID